LAAAIEDNFGTTATLKEGHGGIFEITVNNDLIYSNQKEGGQFPEKEVILQEIGKYTDPLPDTEIKEETPHAESAAPSCKWPP
jgi:selT/selW/selH-like putative selenoprotein